MSFVLIVAKKEVCRFSAIGTPNQRFWAGRGVPRRSQNRWFAVFLTLIPVSATLFAMTSLRQTGYGMISALAGRCRSKSDFLSIVLWMSVLGAVSSGLSGEIHRAVETGDAEKVNTLLINDPALVNADCEDFFGGTALHVVLRPMTLHGQVAVKLSVVRLLLDKGADVNAKDKAKQTPLHMAANSRAISEELIAHKADVNAKDLTGSTPFIKAATWGNLEVMALLLKQGADVNGQDLRNTTAIFHAACNAHKDAVVFLEQKGAKLELFSAIYLGRNEQIKDLLRTGGDSLNKMCLYGMTPLHFASTYGQAAQVEILLAQGADVNARDAHRGTTPLHLAAIRGEKEIVSLLLVHKAEVDAKSNLDYTPLLNAALEKHQVIVEVLLEHKADVNAQTQQGWTALHLASGNGYRDMVEFLLGHGADMERKDAQGKTPLQSALTKRQTEIVDILRKRGAKE